MENIVEYVKERWEQLTSFSRKKELKDQLWDEIVYLYSGQHRHYHNLTHVAYLYSLCDKYVDRMTNKAVIGFAIMYHDIVYDTYRKDNEEQSAEIAEKHLRQLAVNDNLISNVKQFILATKDHKVPADAKLKEDLALFLDFDMAILAAEPELYNLYSQKIRKEYGNYSDDIYKEGRKQALQKVLEADKIFVSSDFQKSMEEPARRNINNEVSLL